MSKHTPGPWKIISRGATIYQIGPIYAEEYAGESWLEVCRADANLIAAAPDLLNALECLMLIFDKSGCEEYVNIQLTPEFFISARGAIAKARGEKE